MSVQVDQLRLDGGFAFGDLDADEVERSQRLLQREQVLAAPVATSVGGCL